MMMNKLLANLRLRLFQLKAEAKAHLDTNYKEIAMIKVMMVCLSVGLGGCVKSDAPLGHSVAQVKTEQIYNPDATQENLLVVPDGTGERMQIGYDRYVGKGEEALSGNSSQVLQEFN